MPITDKHRAAEARFRQLLADAALPEPDSVDYDPDSVVFYWHGPKVAVCVDFDLEPQHARRSSGRGACQLMSTATSSATLPSTV